LVIENHPYRPLADFGRKLVRRLARHGSTFSGVGASDKPGAVQQRLVARYWSRYGGGRSKRRIGSHAGGSALQGFRIAPPSHGEAAPDL
ncbi:hypothetical protein, partial [Sphingomonas faeni]|uniref:hypothetical protein n=1 Tax=Sphingomonas faeni TaxID=185950 RepID=UPI0020C0D8D8